MSYGERKAKREQEIEGLKEALTILSGEALLQASALASCRAICHFGTASAWSGKLQRALSRPYRSEILQLNMRLKALAEIYTKHCFAQL